MGERGSRAPNAQTTSTAAGLDNTEGLTTTTTVASAGHDPSTGTEDLTFGGTQSTLPVDEVAYMDRSSASEIAKIRHLTVTEAVAGALGSRRSDGCVDGPLSQGLLNASGLGAARDKRCGDLSRGQVLRLVLCVGVARAVAGRLVAEPTKPECELNIVFPLCFYRESVERCLFPDLFVMIYYLCYLQ